MADFTISAVLKRLAPLIAENVRREVNLMLNAPKEVQALSEKLEKIQKVLADAERRIVKDERIQSWLQELQDISYDIDDALEEWEMENIRQQLQESEDASESSSDSWENKVCSFLQSACLCFQQAIRRRSIALDVNHINQRLDSLDKENENKFKFIPKLVDSQDENHQGITQRIPSTSFVKVSEVQGRDVDKETLMSFLLSESSDQEEDGVKIVSIVGLGGMGKTTLAQFVYEDDKVKKQFQVKAWVCVSNPFHQIKVARAILQEVDKNSSSLSELNSLLKAIQSSVLGKRFFLVLDDVWTEDRDQWEPLEVCLKSGAPGSRILVTTRKRKVANIMSSTHIHELEPLEDSYCFSLLSQIAFQGREECKSDMLENIGKKIAKKCKGLPLAAKTIGGLLHSRSTAEEWEWALESEIWKLKETRNDIFPLLALSYNELQPAIKRCFSYCAIFPKDEEILVEKLVRMWMAQGFLSTSGGSAEELEHIGRRYFNDLAMRSFFQELREDYDGDHIEFCKMHDIVHDYAQFLSKNDCLIVEKVNDGGAETVSSKDARHLNLILQNEGETSNSTTLTSICNTEKLRSFLCKKSFPPNLLTQLKRIRSLIIRNCGLRDIPDEIGDLIHIRYLDLSGNWVKELPTTICNLYNLEILEIEECWDLCGLPEGIHKLMKVQHIINNGTRRAFRFPEGFEKLTNLHRLLKFSAMKESGNKLGWLKGMNQLGGTLVIDIDSSVDEEAAKKAELGKKKLRDLELHCKDAGLEIVEALCPHPNLQRLRFEVLHLPRWIRTLTNLKFCILHRFDFDETTPNMDALFLHLRKLPSLEELELGYLRMERAVINKASLVGFPKLKKLHFIYCWNWVEWEDISEEEEGEGEENNAILPYLQNLMFSACNSLKRLPHRLLSKVSSLKDLSAGRCARLWRSYNEETGENWNKISHIPRCYVTY